MALLPTIDLFTLNVSNPGTIALTTGIFILGCVRFTIMALFSFLSFNFAKINFMSSKISSLCYDYISENFMFFAYFINCKDRLSSLSSGSYFIFLRSSREPWILAALDCDTSVIALITAILESGWVP